MIINEDSELLPMHGAQPMTAVTRHDVTFTRTVGADREIFF
jgi:hypothetical protein